MSQAEFKKRLKVLMNKPENQICSDCPERQPRWASLIVPPPGSPAGSMAIGAFSCLECSGSHRRLGVHITFVRSVTLDQWKEKEVQAMENGGNAKVNAIFEARLDPNLGIKPVQTASGPVRERFIRDKYERRKYFDPSALQKYMEGEVSDDSDSESDSESEEERPTSRATSSRQKTAVKINAPSQAARLRAESRRKDLAARGVSNSTAKTTITNAMPKTKSVAAKKAVPEMDLLDFGLPISNDSPGPMPNPPSAAPSPTLDMFKTLNVSNNNTASGSEPKLPSSAPPPPPPSAQPAKQENKKMTSEDILAMFHKPAPQQSMPFGFPNTDANGMNNMNNQNMNGMMFNNMPNNNHALMMNMMQNSNSMNGNMMMSNPNNATQMPGNNVQSNMMGMQQSSKVTGSNGYGMVMPSAMQQQQRQSQGMQRNTNQSGTSQNMMMSQQQPMGGAPSNMNVMGGNGMSQQIQFGNVNNFSGGNSSQFQNDPSLSKKNMSNGNNPQMDQFAQFNAFR